MDTRSRKSRSSTPFTQVEDFSKEFLEKEALAESSVRVTRRTITSKVKESKSESIDEVTSSSKILKKLKGASKGSEKKSSWYKTSDYSSEEGENEVSSSRNLSQDEKNQMIEDAKAAANGTGEVSALGLYKQAGTYWELYPKTDYTYSPFSKDRVELAPGVVAMPNMSRKTIHSLGSRSTEVENKETNTDSSYFSKNAAQLYANYIPRQLFNNNYEHNYARTSIKSVTWWSRVKTTTITTITTILTTLISVFYAGFRVQRSWLSKLHKLSSNVMILDTWLLWKNNAGNKGYKLIALCLIPLLLLGGWWILSNLGSLTIGWISSIYSPTIEKQHIPLTENIIQSNPITPIDFNKNDILFNQQKLIDDLKVEISKLRYQMIESEEKRQIDFNKIRADLFYRRNRCCKNSVIDIEKYINRLLVNMLNDPEFLKDQKGLSDYFKTIFTARQELELKLDNITSNLNSKYNDLIQDSTFKLMDEVTVEIKNEISKQSGKFDSGTVGDISEERVKKIVRGILKLYDADKTGLVDYAMESMGAQVLSTRCTENYHYGKAVVSVLGIPLWYPVNSPRTILTPGIHPGQCWAFQNFPGFIMIRLSKRIKVETFSIEHINKLLVPNGEIDSAPKHFEVYGLQDEYDKEPVLLGEYQYEYDGEPLQFFDVQKDDQVFEIIELRIISNHGNPNYTCLYRFRVHGKSV